MGVGVNTITTMPGYTSSLQRRECLALAVFLPCWPRRSRVPSMSADFSVAETAPVERAWPSVVYAETRALHSSSARGRLWKTGYDLAEFRLTEGAMGFATYVSLRFDQKRDTRDGLVVRRFGDED